ncbi:MAG TPA: hypothetical protein VKS79_14660 [Gemmataceae bacterium]|nr:hypothetical protein [Gemmataceae bacterium]
MSHPTRREFQGTLLGSFIAYGLIESLFHHRLFAEEVKPVVGAWLTDLNELSRDLKGRKLTDLEFQKKMEELYRKVNLAELVKHVELDKLAEKNNLPDNGAANWGIDFSKIEGAPAKLLFGKQIFAMKKGRSVVPHGHDNMCTGFIILRGEFHGRHYDRLEDNKDHYIITPTIDATFKPGEMSTISDHKDNVHWFKAASDTGYIFNVHVIGYDPNWPKPANRVYVDPEGEKLSGGKIKAMKMTSAACHKKYG